MHGHECVCERGRVCVHVCMGSEVGKTADPSLLFEKWLSKAVLVQTIFLFLFHFFRRVLFCMQMYYFLRNAIVL